MATIIDGVVFVNGEKIGEVTNISNGVVNISYDRPIVYVVEGGEVNA